MIQVIKDSQYYTDLDQIINSLKMCKQKIDCPHDPVLSASRVYDELDYIIKGIENCKVKGMYLNVAIEGEN